MEGQVLGTSSDLVCSAKVSEGFQNRKGLLIAQEWPLCCDLFECRVYRWVSPVLDLVGHSVICRMCTDAIYKKWKVSYNSRKLSVLLLTDPCTCCKKDSIPCSLKKSGDYSMKLKLTSWDKWRQWPMRCEMSSVCMLASLALKESVLGLFIAGASASLYFELRRFSSHEIPRSKKRQAAFGMLEINRNPPDRTWVWKSMPTPKWIFRVSRNVLARRIFHMASWQKAWWQFWPASSF